MDPNGGIYQVPDDLSDLSEGVKSLLKEDQNRFYDLLNGGQESALTIQDKAWKRRLKELEQRAYQRNLTDLSTEDLPWNSHRP